MKTKYGEFNVGDIWHAADGAGGWCTIVDIDTYADVEDIVIEYADGSQHRMDWFKMSYRYCKEE